MFSTISPRCDFMPTISEAAEDVHHSTNSYTHHHHILSKKKENMRRLFYNEIDDRDKIQNHPSVYQRCILGNSNSSEEADMKTLSEEENTMSSDFDGIGSILDCVERNDEEEKNVMKSDSMNSRTDSLEVAENKHNNTDSCFTVSKFTSSLSTMSARRDNSNSIDCKTINRHDDKSSTSTNQSVGKTVNVQYRKKKWNTFTIKNN